MVDLAQTLSTELAYDRAESTIGDVTLVEEGVGVVHLL